MVNIFVFHWETSQKVDYGVGCHCADVVENCATMNDVWIELARGGRNTLIQDDEVESSSLDGRQGRVSILRYFNAVFAEELLELRQNARNASRLVLDQKAAHHRFLTSVRR